MALAARTFRIFVSSTFSDLTAERNALQWCAFPRLRDLCLGSGARFQAIDLRWGVSEEAGLDQQTMNICLQEIDRCRDISPKPNFIVILGDRYGWQPLPPQIPELEFDLIRLLVGEAERERLSEWYLRDNNAVPPEYCLKPRDVPYDVPGRWGEVEAELTAILRGAVERIPAMRGKSLVDITAMLGTGMDELAAILEKGVEEVEALLRSAADGQGLGDEELRKYWASATEQEIARGALKIPDADEHVFCFFRTIADVPADKDFIDLVPGTTTVDAAAQSRLTELKDTLTAKVGQDNVYPSDVTWQHVQAGLAATRAEDLPPHLVKLCDDVYEALSRVIESEIAALKQEDDIKRERREHRTFAVDRPRIDRGRPARFVGRDGILQEIAHYIDGTGRWADLSRRPLAIVGPSGSGKSALVAHALQGVEPRQPDGDQPEVEPPQEADQPEVDEDERPESERPGPQVVYRFIGWTPLSSGGRDLLYNVCRDISRRYGAEEGTVPEDYRDLAREFPERLNLATADRPLIVFLDALDQLPKNDPARSLVWLPTELPKHVRVIVSTLAEDEHLVPLKRRLPEGNLLSLPLLSSRDGEQLLDRWLEDAGRRLRGDQRREVLTKFASEGVESKDEGLPLYLKLAFEEARRWRWYTAVEPPLQPLAEGVLGIIRQLYERLSDEANHGELIVKRSLGYLAAAKNGLSEDEMLDVLSLGGREGEILEDFFRRAPESPRVDRLPAVIWSRLYLDLGPYLTERIADGASLLTFYHRQLQRVATEDYLKEEGSEERKRLHGDLATYFARQELDIKAAGEGEGKGSPNLRMMVELPYQQTMAQLWGDVFGTLTDFTFLERKAEAVGALSYRGARGETKTTYTGIYQIKEDFELALDKMPGDGGGRPGAGGKRRIIVTGVDFGDGLKIRCPHCNTASEFDERWRGEGAEIDCPQCGGPLRVNPFVVERPRT